MRRIVEGELGSNIPCAICGLDSRGQGTEIGGVRPGETELVWVVVPFCPECLHGDGAPAIEEALVFRLHERGLELVGNEATP